MDISAVDTRSMLNSFPVPAMLVDADHHIIDANAWMIRDTLETDDHCWFSCYQLVHERSEPVDGCPLTKAARTGRACEAVIADERNGRLKVSVTPLELSTGAGSRVFLHLVLPLT